MITTLLVLWLASSFIFLYIGFSLIAMENAWKTLTVRNWIMFGIFALCPILLVIALLFTNEKIIEEEEIV